MSKKGTAMPSHTIKERRKAVKKKGNPRGARRREAGKR